MICALCGKKIEKQISVDHIFPRAIYKWLKQDLLEEEYIELKKAIESHYNIMKVHPECNKEKADELFDLENLYIKESKLEKFEEKKKIIEKYIPLYLVKKDSVLLNQEKRCFKCGERIEDGVLTRKDRKKQRTIDNACVKCKNCINIK